MSVPASADERWGICTLNFSFFLPKTEHNITQTTGTSRTTLSARYARARHRKRTNASCRSASRSSLRSSSDSQTRRHRRMVCVSFFLRCAQDASNENHVSRKVRSRMWVLLFFLDMHNRHIHLTIFPSFFKVTTSLFI